MRLPAATSRSGMSAKWRPAMAITASSSGRRIEPPSIVIVPWQLITVVTPSSSYGFPVAPKPETSATAWGAPLLAAFARSGNLAVPNTAPATVDAAAATDPRNPRRFQVDFIRMNVPGDYFRVTAAMQLISTSESPGRAATATVVRDGPPWGK